jgi:uncharacterized protein YuzE
MRLNYYPDTDSLYIDLSERPSVDSLQISEGVVLDYDAAGNLTGIDIDNASTKSGMLPQDGIFHPVSNVCLVASDRVGQAFQTKRVPLFLAGRSV